MITSNTELHGISRTEHHGTTDKFLSSCLNISVQELRGVKENMGYRDNDHEKIYD